ncbi:N-acetylglucosamine kinase [Mucilaginibacter phyllosphaerae]|uniref:N-acetylglucosamine kinase n=1 Tax=Mucilaginibacter phyllosphaerae TaxID=1812349 RepID=A0A4Y8AA02_9SPHI|nr:N-acetylglucosamine kinase [Mucilaginibacter phyllosphaerae]MBB3969884.1 N-acetylglucosamine kinase-like BadF-type ATPase [Mucilaginibacter phyllosphaerae]TEW65258.1 N-acetylglucosamine kinase [Mucilaginibacter phyllosphaerae]GGH16993.1 ATPase [Mucilaginibacter phyllosphaerae]
MILVADSGSSKTDWLLAVPGQENRAFKSSGLNPYFLTEKEIARIIQDQVPDMVALGNDITEIYFFGAGCSSPDRHEIVSNAISSLIPNAYISVDSDLLASAYATCGHEKGFCCVLGTGSNISFFDGEDIHDGQHGLGYALGDEGAGTWFGKALVTDYLYGNMPDDIHAKFKANYNLSKEDVIINVYQKPRANSYLASFSKFLSEIRKTDYAQALLHRGLQEFVDTNIKCYANYNKFKNHFVGSIAYVFADELKAVCEKNDVHIGKIIRQPINDLLEFILKRG